MITHMDAKIPSYHRYCVLYEGDLQISRDYYCSDPDRYDDYITTLALPEIAFKFLFAVALKLTKLRPFPIPHVN